MFALSQPDLVLPGILPLAITRTYRTQVSDATLFGMPVSGGPFGDGTSWNYDPFLVPPPGGSPDALLLVHPGNRQDLFTRQPDGTFTNSTSLLSGEPPSPSTAPAAPSGSRTGGPGGSTSRAASSPRPTATATR